MVVGVSALGPQGVIGCALMNSNKKRNIEKEEFTVANALQRIDTPSILFFLGILLAVAALDASNSNSLRIHH